jgi:hypothetical protein
LYWPLIADGGVMAFHDVAAADHPDITKCRWWREIRDNGPQVASYTYEYNDKLTQSMGIGVLLK